MSTEPRCYLCGTTEGVEWCSTCQVYLCRACARDWPARIAGAVRKLLGQVFGGTT